MTERPRLDWRNARFALRVATGAFFVVAAALVAWRGVGLPPARECVVTTWAPLRGLPWLLVALVPPLVYAGVLALAARGRARSSTLGEGPYRQSVHAAPPIVRPRRHPQMLALLVVVGLALAVLESRRWSCPYAVPASCRPKTSRIVMMPVGPTDRALVEDLARHFRDCYALPVVVGPSMAAPMNAWNAKRQQWTAEGLLAAMPGCSDGDPLCEPDLIIGITSEDIYTSAETWRYAFTIRQPERHVAIVSTARMASLPVDPLSDRLSKMTAKTIALEYCGLPPSNDPRSVRFNGILGPANLDTIDESVW